MNRTRYYHLLSTVFGLSALAFGASRLAQSLTLSAGLFAVAGSVMALVSGLALARPDLDDTAEPPAWKLAVLAVGVLLFLVGGVVTLQS